MLRIVVVDDEVMALSLLSDCISSYEPQFTVSGSFTSGEDALAFLSHEPCDVLITDINMPGMSGLELAQKTSELYPKIKTIIVSAYQDFEYAKKAIEYGVYLYLVKPICFTELHDALTRIDREHEKALHPDTFKVEPVELFHRYITGASLSSVDLTDEAQALGLSEGMFTKKVLVADIALDRNEMSVFWSNDNSRPVYFLRNIIRDSLKCENVYLAYNERKRFIFIGFMPFETDEAAFKKSIALFSANLLDRVVLTEFSDITGIKNYFNTHSYTVSPEKAADSLSDHEEYDMILKAKAYIEKNYPSNLSRDDVAAHIYLSPSYFSKLFKRITGKSFSEYLAEIRIKNAILLLEKGENPSRIYTKVGYNNNKYFIKNFLKITLYTPAEYQQTMLKTGDLYED